ncbi:solute carrier organic anion transporter family member 2A1 [Lasioglossum baleicum]|uniref:solute carrier organic anion transporter family member 2A1 n=1 Tax=Lasioglossum baleicum TaxID=434251 RepID=UPI003FCE1EF7
MTIRLHEVVRSEVEGGLTGPANPIPNESIDCGCAQVPCPKLARFATRGLFIGLLSWIGLIQAAAYGYFYVAGPTIARRFQIDPYVMEWVLAIPDLIPFLLGLLVAYWGDRIHRAAWVGGIVLLQSASFIVMIIPHLTHQTKVVDETEDMMRTTVYAHADDNRDLCSGTSTKIVAKDEEPCYFTFAALVVVQIITGIANISYYALAISYLDDNTKKKHVAGFIGVAIAVKIVGVLLGFMLAWVCLRLDAVTLTTIDSYRAHIGAWWLGLPILTVLLVVPGLLLSWFPRMLPSQVVERAAVALLTNSLDRPSRTLRRFASEKPESPGFFPSVGRLFTNKILIFIVLGYTLYMMATVNFMVYENLIIQARFHVPKPTGLLLGFNDPIVSRLATNVLKPILIGLLVVISGLIMSKAKPNARSVVAYGVVITFLAAGIIVALTLTSCEKRPIVETDAKGQISLPTYCNRNCSCSNDADFRPVCESKGTVTYYSPCHAGCRSSEYKNGRTVYSNCYCVKDAEMYDGPCDENACQTSWVMFELGTMLVYALIATMFIGDFLVVLRSSYTQDKAISIGFWMMWSAVVVNVGGKFLYDSIANLTCHYWGTKRSKCHLHESLKLGDYLCYLTAAILVLSILIKVVLWYLCKNVQLYAQQNKETSTGTEMRRLMTRMTAKQTQPITGSNNNNTVQVEVTNEPAAEPLEREEEQNESVPLKYGPLGPGDRRTGSKSSLSQASHSRRSDIRTLDSEDDLSTSDEEGKKNSSPKVAYRPLDIDSDVESDLSSTAPRSRKRIHSKDYDIVYGDSSPSVPKPWSKREFPDPANYDDPRLSRRLESDQNGYVDGSKKTDSFEYSKNNKQRQGDFNEVGIPVVEDYPPKTTDSPFIKDVKSLINQYEHSDQPDGDAESVRSTESGRLQYRVVAGIPLVAMASKRQSKGPSSSGHSSFSNDKHPEDPPESRQSNSPKMSVDKGSKGTLHTDF